MSDMWDKDPLDQPSADPAEPIEPSAPAEPEAPQPPQTPPMNGFAPDGSYRYVPPRGAQPTPPPYQAPTQNPYYNPAYTQSSQPVAPPPPQRKGNVWIVAVAVLSAIGMLFFAMFGIYLLSKRVTPQQPATDSMVQTGTNGTGTGHKQDLVITPGGNAEDIDPDADYYYGDGGLSTEAIVSKNYNSTVVLTMYMESDYQYFGKDNMQEVGAASGIVWTEDGYIITNCHCVIDETTGEEFDRIDVTLYNGTTYEAEVIGADESTDLAVIKVNATGLTPAVFGDSNELAVGARVVALGNAAGLSWTATQGIVSAKARDVYEDTGYALQCLQVDVAINSGNSGGPLLNKFGQVIAINSAKIAASGYEGLGFSIPITEAKPILQSLLEFGYVKGRVALGVTGQTIDTGYYQGFMIREIVKGSCMEGTAAQPGDLIVAVDDVTVTDYGTLRAALAKHKVGDKVKIKLLRSNRGTVTEINVEVTLKEQTAN